MGQDFEVVVDQRDMLDIRLPAQFFDVFLHSDLFAKIDDVIGIGVDGDNAGKAPGADGDTEYAALPKFLCCDFRRRRGCILRQTPAPAPHEGHHGPALLIGLRRRQFPHASHHLLHAPGGRRGRGSAAAAPWNRAVQFC